MKDIESIRSAINDLRLKSVCCNADENAPVTGQNLRNLRDNIADILEKIIESMD